MSSLRWRIALVVVIAVLGIVYTLPSFQAVRDSSLGAVLPPDEINLGLDLRGGIHLTLGVDVDKAVENSLSQMGQDIKDQAKEDGMALVRFTPQKNDALSFLLTDASKKSALDKLLSEHFSKTLQVISSTPEDDNRVRYLIQFLPAYRKYVADLAVDQAIKTIRNRIDQFGVSEPDIRRQEGNRIQVQLPGLQDPQRAIEIIGKTAHLEFKIVNDKADPAKAAKGLLPPGTELSTIVTRNLDGTTTDHPIVLDKDTVMTGEYISDANVGFDQSNQAYVSLTFSPRGSRLFERVTGDNVQKRMAIVLDGKVYSAPTIQEKIAGGRASITGRFTTDEARDLAIVLRAGALPAPVNILEQRSVGPSLGQESIEKGVYSALIGFSLVVVFMVIYYRFAGFVADVALILNMILITAGLAAFGATLTLPGIAGIILTIGMAVDANVLIFERIREEVRRGLTTRAAVQEGYSRATLTILDANITTVIAALVLYQYGTGPIRGFAVTLILGTIASMFTAIFVSRVLFDIWLNMKHKSSALSV